MSISETQKVCHGADSDILSVLGAEWVSECLQGGRECDFLRTPLPVILYELKSLHTFTSRKR